MKPNDVQWQDTRVLTQMATRLFDEDSYLGRDAPQIGTAVGDNRHELFVVCEPAQALAQLIEFHKPDFIALHDIGAPRSAAWLGEIAGALSLPLQHLLIRRQGQGSTLAELVFIQLPAPKGQAGVRVYSSQASGCEAALRESLGLTLLAHSRLAVVLVSAMPAMLLGGLMQPLKRAMQGLGQWPNREMLLVPSAPMDKALAPQVQELVAAQPLNLQLCPPTAQAQGLWPHVHSAWERLRLEASGQLPASTPQVVAPGFSLSMPSEAPDASSATSLSAPGAAATLAAASRAAAASAAVSASATPSAAAYAAASATASAAASAAVSARSFAPASAPAMAAKPAVLSAPAPPMAAASTTTSTAEPLRMRPMPAHGAKAVMHTTTQLQAYTQACAKLRGALAACSFDRLAPRRAVMAGDARLALRLGGEAAALLNAAQETARGLDVLEQDPALLLQVGSRLLLVQPLPGGGTQALALLFDAALANPLLVRMQVQRLAPLLDESH